MRQAVTFAQIGPPFFPGELRLPVLAESNMLSGGIQDYSPQGTEWPTRNLRTELLEFGPPGHEDEIREQKRIRAVVDPCIVYRREIPTTTVKTNRRPASDGIRTLRASHHNWGISRKEDCRRVARATRMLSPRGANGLALRCLAGCSASAVLQQNTRVNACLAKCSRFKNC